MTDPFKLPSQKVMGRQGKVSYSRLRRAEWISGLGGRCGSHDVRARVRTAITPRDFSPGLSYNLLSSITYPPTPPTPPTYSLLSPSRPAVQTNHRPTDLPLHHLSDSASHRPTDRSHLRIPSYRPTNLRPKQFLSASHSFLHKST